MLWICLFVENFDMKTFLFLLIIIIVRPSISVIAWIGWDFCTILLCLFWKNRRTTHHSISIDLAWEKPVFFCASFWAPRSELPKSLREMHSTNPRSTRFDNHNGRDCGPGACKFNWDTLVAKNRVNKLCFSAEVLGGGHTAARVSRVLYR